jgi:predicted nucleic acid-binding protein
VILVDTSVWVDHFRGRDTRLITLIENEAVALHPFVFGELLLAGLPSDGEAASQLLALAAAPVGSTHEANIFISNAGLRGTGVGYVDSHLLMSARLLPRGRVLTGDKRLHAQAERLGLAYAS